jgi:hypothetical protein
MFVNDTNMISMVLALGAGNQVTAVSSLREDGAAALRRHHGAAVDALKVVSPETPALETVLANRPDVRPRRRAAGRARPSSPCSRPGSRTCRASSPPGRSTAPRFPLVGPCEWYWSL